MSRDRSAASGPRFAVLGRVVGAHALRGELRVRLYGDGPENLAYVDEVVLSADEAGGSGEHFEVIGVGSGRAGEARLALSGIEDRDRAEAMKGRFVLADAEALEPLAEDEFYWHELVGCRVETEAGEPVGEIREIWETGAHDVLVVRTPDGRQVLVPTAREIMTGVDVESGRVTIDPPPGLLHDPDE